MNVYIIQANQYFKIGKADDIYKRFEGLQCANPIKLKLIAAVDESNMKDGKTFNAFEKEKEIHTYLKKYRVRGEWFLLSVEQVEEIIEKYNFDVLEFEIRIAEKGVTGDVFAIFKEAIENEANQKIKENEVKAKQEIEEIEKRLKQELKDHKAKFDKEAANKEVRKILGRYSKEDYQYKVIKMDLKDEYEKWKAAYKEQLIKYMIDGIKQNCIWDI